MKTLKHLISGSVAALVVVAGLAYAQSTPEPTTAPEPAPPPATEPMAPAAPPSATSPSEPAAPADMPTDKPAKADRN
jgi:hypothetical protein